MSDNNPFLRPNMERRPDYKKMYEQLAEVEKAHRAQVVALRCEVTASNKLADLWKEVAEECMRGRDENI